MKNLGALVAPSFARLQKPQPVDDGDVGVITLRLRSFSQTDSTLRPFDIFWSMNGRSSGSGVEFPAKKIETARRISLASRRPRFSFCKRLLSSSSAECRTRASTGVDQGRGDPLEQDLKVDLEY
jgi:hypothetical protein